MDQPRTPKQSESELINKDATDTRDPSGYSWRDRIGVVRGFRITTARATPGGKTSIASVENLSDVAVANSHRLHAHGETHYFLLLPAETIVQVDVYATHAKRGLVVSTSQKRPMLSPTADTPAQIHELRFRTTERVSAWFGTCEGTLTQLKAAADHYIHAMYGSHGAKGCIQLGAVFTPYATSASAATVSPSTRHLSSVVRCSDPAAQLSFRTECDAPRAVVVRVSTCIRDTTVLSPFQYEAFSEFVATHDHAAADRWFVLAKDERIEAVGLKQDNKRFVAIAFRTNYRTSEWFGPPIAGIEATWLDCTEHPGSFICGFHVEGYGTTECTQVTSVAAIYKCPAVASGSTDTKKAVDAVGHASKAA